MKFLYLSIIFLLVFLNGHSQITKNNWLVGGTASYSSSTTINSYNNEENRVTRWGIAPNLGYFILDKFAIGLNPGISFTKSNWSFGESHVTFYNIAPFARYYFLETEKTLNLFLQGSTGYSFSRAKNYTNPLQKSSYFSYSISGGPVLYFNTSVGLEFTGSYNHLRSIEEKAGNNSFIFGIGLQVHLER